MSRFLVTWRSRTTERTYPVGVLITRGQDFLFSYLPRVARLEDFRAFVNFPDLHREYHSSRLFPFFSQRVMDRRRPDHQAYVAALGLPANASDIDVLGRSSGQRKGDTVQVILEPSVEPDGSVHHEFLLSGTRYAPGDAPSVIDALQQGAELTFRPQPENLVNPDARLICESHGEALGWVPDALLGFVQQVIANDYRLTATQVNGPEWPNHLRVVAQLRGSVTPGFLPFESLIALAPA